MATGHALSGVALGLYSLPLCPDQSPQGQVVWVALVTGLILGPDWDAPGTTVARMWGPISGGLKVRFWRRGRRWKIAPGIVDLIGAITGGHRGGTHSIVGVIAVLVLVWLASLTSIGTGIVVAIGVGLALAVFGLLPGKQPGEWWPVNVLISFGAGYMAYRQGWELPSYLPWPMALGWAGHIVGDMLTVQGCNLSWPLEGKRVSLLPIRAGGPTERFVLRPVFVVLIVQAVGVMLGYDPLGSLWFATRELMA